MGRKFLKYTIFFLPVFFAKSMNLEIACKIFNITQDASMNQIDHIYSQFCQLAKTALITPRRLYYITQAYEFLIRCKSEQGDSFRYLLYEEILATVIKELEMKRDQKREERAKFLYEQFEKDDGSRNIQTNFNTALQQNIEKKMKGSVEVSAEPFIFNEDNNEESMFTDEEWNALPLFGGHDDDEEE